MGRSLQTWGWPVLTHGMEKKMQRLGWSLIFPNQRKNHQYLARWFPWFSRKLLQIWLSGDSLFSSGTQWTGRCRWLNLADTQKTIPPRLDSEGMNVFVYVGVWHPVTLWFHRFYALKINWKKKDLVLHFFIDFFFFCLMDFLYIKNYILLRPFI